MKKLMEEAEKLPSLDVGEIMAAVERLKNKPGAKLIVIDSYSSSLSRSPSGSSPRPARKRRTRC